MSALLAQYAAAVRANPGQAKNAENVLRMLLFTMTDANSLLQIQGGLCACNLLALLHEVIADPDAAVGERGGCCASSRCARIAHRALCEAQCLIELVARSKVFVARPRAAHHVVVGVEALKSTLIVAWRWRTVKHTLRRAAATLTEKAPAEYDSALGRPGTVRVPAVALDRVDPVTGAVTPAPFTSWREWVSLFVDLGYLARPVWYAYAALVTLRRHTATIGRRGGAAAGVNAIANVARKSGNRGAWRAWLMSLVFEALLVLATFVAESGAPPIVAQEAVDADFGEPVPGAGGDEEALYQRRLRGLGAYLGRNPFFRLYLKHRVQRWVVRGWVARHVPLIGPMIAYQADVALKLQDRCFLYSAGGADAPETTAFRGPR